MAAWRKLLTSWFFAFGSRVAGKESRPARGASRCLPSAAERLEILWIQNQLQTRVSRPLTVDPLELEIVGVWHELKLACCAARPGYKRAARIGHGS